jgi:hypothetical protein
MSAPARQEPLSELVRRHCGIATRAQLRDAGVTVATLIGHLDARRWRKLNDQVVCMHNGPLTRRQALWAALLSVPPPAALCVPTVLELYGVHGSATPVVHLLVRPGARVLPVPGVTVKVHESAGSRPATCGTSTASS